MSLKISVDFTDVKESSGLNPKRLPAGDYIAKITDVKKDKSKSENDMLVFTFVPEDHRSTAYPYYVVLDKNSLWKLRNILIAVGAKAPKGKANIDVERLKGKLVGISLEDDEYEGKEKSVIDSIFSANEVETDDAPSMDEDDEPDTEPDTDDEPEEEPEEKPARRKRKAKPAPEPEPEEDEDDDDLAELDL